MPVNAHVFGVARKAGVTTVLNPAPMRGDFDPSVLALVDVLIPNETEFVTLVNLLGAVAAIYERRDGGHRPLQNEPFTEAALHALPPAELHALCRMLGVSTVIVTLGKRGAVYFEPGETPASPVRTALIPPEQVIGSSTKMQLEWNDGTPVLRKLPELGSFDDRDEKVVNIGLHLGRRPILAFGNSDGDLAMLRYTLAGSGARLGLLLHHDDGEREFAYDRDFKLSPLRDGLDHAADYGIGVVSMKQDWKRVFADA